MVKPVPKNVKDLTGQVFGWLIVMGFLGTRNRHAEWLCRCSCDNLIRRSLRNLRGTLQKGGVPRCSRCVGKSKINSLIDMRFGALTVLRLVEGSIGTRTIRWECMCDCGKPFVAVGRGLLNGRIQSCGANIHRQRYKNEEETRYRNRYVAVKHGAKWRGISFSLSFEDFLNVMLSSQCFYCSEIENYLSTRISRDAKDVKVKIRAMSVDRYDSSKGYTKENCVPCCKACQVRKMDTHGDQFIADMIRIGKYLEQKQQEKACASLME